jgi:hypothetical protein
MGALAAMGLALAGCNNAGQGAASGATVGALSGLAIGSMFGSAGKGAAIGAIAGGGTGAVIGDQNRRQSEQSAQAAARSRPAPAAAPSPAPAAPVPPAVATADQNRLALVRFARSWSIAGWQTVNGQRQLVSGTATGTVENAFFVKLVVRVADDQTGWTSSGEVWFASEPGRGITMDSRFDTLPIPVTHAGGVSADGSVFTLDETTPGVVGRRTVIRFLSDSEFVVDDSERVNGRMNPIGSLSFSATR